MISQFSKSILFLTIFLALSASTFLNLWMFLEINLMMFIMWSFYSMNKDSGVKYFFIQSFFSTILLFNYFSFVYCKLWMFYFFSFLSVMGKLGLPPLMYWFINIISNSKLECMFILSTLQKIIPLLMLDAFNIPLNSWLMFTLYLILTATMNLMHFKKMMAYSSIFNLIWMVIALENKFFMFLFMMIYMFNLSWMLNSLNFMNYGNILSENSMFKLNRLHFLILIFSVLSLAGFPPFLGFMGKFVIIKYMLFFYPAMLSMMVVASFFMGYLYLRIIFLFFMRKKNMITNFMLKQKIVMFYFYLNFIMMFFLFML